MTRVIALIPARAGSKRIKNKNIKEFSGHPLIAYTINVALKSKIFSDIIVSTDSSKIAEIARYYGADVPFLRPPEFATDTSPDIHWLKYTLQKLKFDSQNYFSILRPTSPFRSKEMIINAWSNISKDRKADSIRAVERCSEHPAKMWYIKGDRMIPVLQNPDERGIEWYSTPMQALPEIYKQNSSLEIAKAQIPLTSNSIAGENIIPFITDGFEGYDLNSPKDWIYAEYLIKNNKVKLPEISKSPFLS